MDYEEKRVFIGSCMIVEYVGKIVDAGNDEGIGEDNGGSEVKV